MSYLHSALQNPRDTPQTRAIPGREADMVANSAGGFVFGVDDFARLRRFLVLGTEGGSYYASQNKLTQENAEVVLRCLKADGERTVQEIVEISREGRAPKNDQAIYALALATVPAHADEATRREAFLAIPLVCRTGTHLFMFCSFVDGMRGWGKGLQRAVARWYENKDGDQLAYQVVKYRNREGWTHKDVLRTVHNTKDSPHGLIYDWIFGGTSSSSTGDARQGGAGTVRTGKQHVLGAMPEAIQAFEAAQAATSPRDIVRLIDKYGNTLPHEAIPTEYKADAGVWSALLEAGMPIGAMIRNLANMTRYGILQGNSDGTMIVVGALTNVDQLTSARVHPMQILLALKQYSSGGVRPYNGWGYDAPRSGRSQNTWTPNPQITKALNDAFYLAFQNVVPSNKRFVLGLDVSGSMSAYIGDTFLTCAEGAAAMALMTDHAEPFCVTHGFAGNFVDLGIHAGMTLEDALAKTRRANFGTTNAAVPFQWALRNNVAADTFVVITDSETYAGQPHASQALQNYRRETGINARLVVVAMVSNGFTIADPNDAGMLDVVGFDAATPRLISDFSAGLI